MKKVGFFTAIGKAFAYIPKGMWISPNWLGILAIILLGTLNPAVWLIGVGLEMGYLLLMAQAPSFRDKLDEQVRKDSTKEAQARLERAIAELDYESRCRYNKLKEKCSAVMKNSDSSMSQFNGQTDTLNRLLWLYMSLLQGRQQIKAMVAKPEADHQALVAKQKLLANKLLNNSLSNELRNSLMSQMNIIEQRIKSQNDLIGRFDYVDAELGRIEEQVEWAKEQSAMITDTTASCQTLDSITNTLQSTGDWMREKKEIFGGLEDAFSDVPPILEL